jgi:hypothetical protein
MTELTKKTLSKIKKEGIRFIPKWHFLAKEWFMWLTFFISVLVGGVAGSIIIYRVLNNEWELAPYLADSFTGFVLITLPYFWIALLIAFILLADYQFKQTKEGYKYQFVWILALNLVLSLGLGVILYKGNFSEKIEAAFENYLPYYGQLAPPRHRLWMNPDRGLLMGRILEMGSGSALLEDLDGRNWEVEIGPDFAFENKVGEIIRLMGERHAENLFKMRKLNPWQGPDLFLGKPLPKLKKILDNKNVLQIELVGDGQGDFEATIEIQDGDLQSTQEFFESPEVVGQRHILQVAKGDDEFVDEVIVKWGSGAEDSFENVKVGEVLRVEEK